MSDTLMKARKRREEMDAPPFKDESVWCVMPIGSVMLLGKLIAENCSHHASEIIARKIRESVERNKHMGAPDKEFQRGFNFVAEEITHYLFRNGYYGNPHLPETKDRVDAKVQEDFDGATVQHSDEHNFIGAIKCSRLDSDQTARVLKCFDEADRKTRTDMMVMWECRQTTQSFYLDFARAYNTLGEISEAA